MSTTHSIWYRLGYALEKARKSPLQKRLASLADRQAEGAHGDESLLTQISDAFLGGSKNGSEGAVDGLEGSKNGSGSAEDEGSRGGAVGKAFADVDVGELAPLLGTVGIAAVTRLVARKPLTLGGMVRAALVGAGAETVRLVVRRLRTGRVSEEELTDDLVRGAANGLVYGTLLGPIAPGAALGKGLIYGAGSFLASDHGGLPEVLGSVSPHRRIPGLSGLVMPVVDQEDVVDHLIFGIVLAVLYESSRASSGT